MDSRRWFEALTNTLFTSKSTPQPVLRATAARNSASGIAEAAKLQVGRRIFDQYRPAQRLLDLPDVAAHDLQSLFGIGQGQKIGQKIPAAHTPGKMIRHQGGRSALLQIAQAPQVCPVHALRRTERTGRSA